VAVKVVDKIVCLSKRQRYNGKFVHGLYFSALSAVCRARSARPSE
jgi:hypothetical protein